MSGSTTETARPRTDSGVSDAAAPYVPPFKIVENALQLNHFNLDAGKVTIPARLFRHLMALAIAQGSFDERWYLETYPDVERGITEDVIPSAWSHYVNTGYYENRSPGPCFVDQKWYETYYPDIGEAVRAGMICDSAEHFWNDGYFEGRISCADQTSDLESWLELLEYKP